MTLKWYISQLVKREMKVITQKETQWHAWGKVSALKDTMEIWQKSSQLNWSLVHEKQTEERNWSWFQLSFKDYKAVVQVQSCVVLMFELLVKYIPHLSGPTTAFQCFLPSHVFRGDNQLWKYWCLWWLRGKLSLLLRFPRKIERLGDALGMTVWSKGVLEKHKAATSKEQKLRFIETEGKKGSSTKGR